MEESVQTSKYARTHQGLIAATLAEICATGTFSAEAVTRRCNQSVATFYKHFAAKDEAMADAFGLALDELVTQVQAQWTIEKLLAEGAETVCRDGVYAAISYFNKHLLIFRTALADLPTSKRIRAVYRSHEAQILEHFEQLIRLGQRAGKIRGQADDVVTIARTHLVLTQGLNNHNLLGQHDDAVFGAMAAAIQANLVGSRPTDNE
ncbi:MAG: TetR/AcrR family transcriptional regulator [Pseudomonadota bacterium]